MICRVINRNSKEYPVKMNHLMVICTLFFNLSCGRERSTKKSLNEIVSEKTDLIDRKEPSKTDLNENSSNDINGIYDVTFFPILGQNTPKGEFSFYIDEFYFRVKVLLQNLEMNVKHYQVLNESSRCPGKRVMLILMDT